HDAAPPAPYPAPYTTLFRSGDVPLRRHAGDLREQHPEHDVVRVRVDAREVARRARRPHLEPEPDEPLRGEVPEPHLLDALRAREDRKSTRLNSSHVKISYAV